MMNDHFRVGHKYQSVDISTAYSFGLDDQEFVLSFETNELSDFVSLVMELQRSGRRFLYGPRDAYIYRVPHACEAGIGSTGLTRNGRVV